MRLRLLDKIFSIYDNSRSDASFPLKVLAVSIVASQESETTTDEPIEQHEQHEISGTAGAKVRRERRSAVVMY